MRYHINSRTSSKTFDGTEQNPFISFAQAEKIAKPGDTFLVSGVIHELVKWNVSGEKDKPITFLRKTEETEAFIDGKYEIPSTTDEKIGADGLKGNHLPLVLIDASYIVWSIPVRNSRGQGMRIGSEKSNQTNILLENFSINGCRLTGVDARNVMTITIDNVTFTDTSNYNTRVRGATKYNFAGCIKTLGVDGLIVKNCSISKHYGNVLTPSRRTKNIRLENNKIFDCWGSLIYLHFCNTAVVTNNYLFYTDAWKQSIHAGIVVNNEEEFVDEGFTPGNFVIENNFIFGVSNGISTWGNEGEDVVTAKIEIKNNIIINTVETGILIRDNRKVKDVLITGNYISTLKKSIEANGGYSNLTIHTNGFVKLPATPKEISSPTDFTVKTFQGNKTTFVLLAQLVDSILNDKTEELKRLQEELEALKVAFEVESGVINDTLIELKRKFDADEAVILAKIEALKRKSGQK